MEKQTGYSEAGLPVFGDELFEPYENLAKAIVRQAAKDYLMVYGKFLRARTQKEMRKLQTVKDELEEFFFSTWYGNLTEIDPDRLVTFLREKAIEGERKRIRKKV